MIFSTQSVFFWELVTLIGIMLLGHWIEIRSVHRASGAVDKLAELMPDTAERITESGDTEEVPAGELSVGDLDEDSALHEEGQELRIKVREIVDEENGEVVVPE